MSPARGRVTLRWRLALLYGGLLAVVSAVLLGLATFLVDRTIEATASFAPGTLVRVQGAGGQNFLVHAEDLSAALRSQAVETLLQTGAIAFGLVVLTGAAAGYVVAARALRPIAAITATARRLSTETLAERIALSGPQDELRELADTFDEMLARLDAAFDSQRRFVANASHELRTPLAVMRTEVDVALADPQAEVADLRRMGELVMAAVERADRLVEALLLLARADAQSRQGLQAREAVDLSAMVPRALAALSAEIGQHQLLVDTELHPAITTGDPVLLERMVGNVVENAVRHNIEGGWVRVATATGPEGSALSVTNSGSALDADTAAEMFSPFWRGGAARTSGRGAGLGLSIVRAVVLAHAGHVVAAPRATGGMDVTVRLPGHLMEGSL